MSKNLYNSPVIVKYTQHDQNHQDIFKKQVQINFDNVSQTNSSKNQSIPYQSDLCKTDDKKLLGQIYIYKNSQIYDSFRLSAKKQISYKNQKTNLQGSKGKQNINIVKIQNYYFKKQNNSLMRTEMPQLNKANNKNPYILELALKRIVKLEQELAEYKKYKPLLEKLYQQNQRQQSYLSLKKETLKIHVNNDLQLQNEQNNIYKII